MVKSEVIVLRQKRQHLDQSVNKKTYEQMFREFSPVQPIYWTMPGNPPEIVHRAEFDDKAYNSSIRAKRTIVKGRFAGGNIGYVYLDELDLYGAAYMKSRDNLTYEEEMLMRLFEQEGPMSIGLIKEITEQKAKDITKILHKLQLKFLVYEDQLDSEWDRGFFLLENELDEVDLFRYTKEEAITILMKRFIYRHVVADVSMIKSFYRFIGKDIKAALNRLEDASIITYIDESDVKGYALTEDLAVIESMKGQKPCSSIYILHRNDYLVKSNEHWLKEHYKLEGQTNIYYVLIDGEFRGCIYGKFRNGPFDLEDLELDFNDEEAMMCKDKVLEALYEISEQDSSPLKHYMGKPL